MRVPTSIPDDGSWVRLAGQEIAGEFLGEMGRTLHVFRATLGQIDARLRTLMKYDTI